MVLLNFLGYKKGMGNVSKPWTDNRSVFMAALECG